ncbi:hypothetical protein [Sphingobacterium faecium]
MLEKQIFQTTNKKRWYAFTWMSIFLFIALGIAVICVFYTILAIQSPPFPTIDTNSKLTEKAIGKLKDSKKFKDFSLTKDQLLKIKQDRELKRLHHVGTDKRINMGFYVSTWSKEVRDRSVTIKYKAEY